MISLYNKVNSSRQVLQTHSEICILLCDAIDLKQSVEGTLKTVLNKVHFINN